MSLRYNSPIGNSTLESTPQGFTFTLGMGRLLRQLRRQARLTLKEMAHVMGHPPGFASHLSRLEAGRIPTPSLALLVDYLRACRASFADLVPVLAEYTNRPPLRETPVREQVLAELAPLGGREALGLVKYDSKRGEELRPEVRVRAAAKQAMAAAERRRLERMMMWEVNRLGVQPTMLVCKVAYDYARMVWKALGQTERNQKSEIRNVKLEVGKDEETSGKRRGRPRKTRKQRLREARARILKIAPRILPAKALDQVRDKVVRLYEETQMRGTEGGAD